jgi:hypothetical protein
MLSGNSFYSQVALKTHYVKPYKKAAQLLGKTTLGFG